MHLHPPQQPGQSRQAVQPQAPLEHRQ
jgi:hypothetical protein